jgi:hypothetical protein
VCAGGEEEEAMITSDLLATCSGGIMFTGESIRALRDGRKTRTTRLMNPQPPKWCDRAGWTCFTPNGKVSFLGIHPEHGTAEKFLPGPRYQTCKRYYVKETWCPAIDDGNFFYQIDTPDVRLVDGHEFGVFRKDGSEASPWKSPMHMPRDAARYVIEIDDVTPMRLQSMTEMMVQEEGVYTWAEGDHTCNTIETYFAPRWNKTNGKRAPWSSNPWVWNYSFHLVKP